MRRTIATYFAAGIAAVLILTNPAFVRASTMIDVTVSVQGQAVMTSCVFEPVWCQQHLGTPYLGGWWPDFTFRADDPMTSFRGEALAEWSNPAYGSAVYLMRSEFIDRGDGCPDCAVWSLDFQGDWLPGMNLPVTTATGSLSESLFSGEGSATYTFTGTIAVSGSILSDAPAPDPPGDPTAPEPATAVYLLCAGVLLALARRLRAAST